MQHESNQAQQLAQHKALVVQQLRLMFQQQVTEVDSLRQQLTTVQYYCQQKVAKCDTITKTVHEQKIFSSKNIVENQFKAQQHQHTINMMEMNNKNKYIMI